MSVASLLEEKYKHRGLRFDGFGGSHPVQADGEIDGEEFYFRFRGDSATLEVGRLYFIGEEYVTMLSDKYCKAFSSVKKVTGDKHCGDLNDEQRVQVFSELVDTLGPWVPNVPYTEAEIEKLLEKKLARRAKEVELEILEDSFEAFSEHMKSIEKDK